MLDLDKILNIVTAEIEPLRGRVLISNPLLFDFFFKRSVVLLIEHNQDGSFGVIINKPLDVKVSDFTGSIIDITSKVFLGGPVKTEGVFFIHTIGDIIPESVKIIDGLFWGGSNEALNAYIKSNPEEAAGKIRFFMGYSGWTSNQLNEEIINRSWLVADTSLDEIMSVPDSELWKIKVEKLGKAYKPWLNMPADSSYN